MPPTEGPPYTVEDREVVAETPDLRVVILTLGSDQCVPWHRHSQITDTFFCLDGPMVVATRDPPARHELAAWGRCAVPPNTAHQVTPADGSCRFLLVQGIGTYDYLAPI